MIERQAPIAIRQVHYNRGEQQAGERHSPGISDRNDYLPQQNRSIRYASGQQRFKCMSLTLSGYGIANNADDVLERHQNHYKHHGERELKPPKPGSVRESNTHNADHDEGAYQLPPPPLEDQVLRFFPYHGPDVAH